MNRGSRELVPAAMRRLGGAPAPRGESCSSPVGDIPAPRGAGALVFLLATI